MRSVSADSQPPRMPRPVEDLEHRVEVPDARRVGEHDRLVGEQRRRHQREHGVLRAARAAPSRAAARHPRSGIGPFKPSAKRPRTTRGIPARSGNALHFGCARGAQQLLDRVGLADADLEGQIARPLEQRRRFGAEPADRVQPVGPAVERDAAARGAARARGPRSRPARRRADSRPPGRRPRRVRQAARPGRAARARRSPGSPGSARHLERRGRDVDRHDLERRAARARAPR